MNLYFIHDGRNELGPFTIQQLRERKLTRSLPVREEGSDNWIPAEKISELKEMVAPTRIRRPKDIVPVIINRASEFRQKRPVIAHAILLSIGLCTAISIYSIGKSAGRTQPTALAAPAITPPKVTFAVAAIGEELTQIPPTELVTQPVKETPKKPENVDRAKAARLQWKHLITVTNSGYGIGFLGGIKDLKVIVSNRSNYVVDEVVAKLTYVKASGEVWKTKLVTIKDVGAHGIKEEEVPDVSRSKKVTISLQKLVSKKMKFNYTAAKKIVNREDPYFTE